MLSVEVVAAFALPGLVNLAPGYVNDVVAAAFGGTPVGDIGGMKTVLAVSGLGYMAGGLIFGIALFRARILARWASRSLAAGTVATVSLAVLPESFNRPMAVPVGVALIGLGLSLWRDQRTPGTRDRFSRPPASSTRASDGQSRTSGLPGRTPRSPRPRSWLVPIALLMLGVVPVLAGTLRLAQLAGGPALMPADHRFDGFPLALGCTSSAPSCTRSWVPSSSCPRSPPSPPGLASRCRSGPDRGRPDRRRVGALDDAVLRTAARHRLAALCAAPGVRRRDGLLPGSRRHHDPPRRRGWASRVDDPRVRHRSGRRDAGVHRRDRRCVVRHRCTCKETSPRRLRGRSTSPSRSGSSVVRLGPRHRAFPAELPVARRRSECRRDDERPLGLRASSRRTSGRSVVVLVRGSRHRSTRRRDVHAARARWSTRRNCTASSPGCATSARPCCRCVRLVMTMADRSGDAMTRDRPPAQPR